MSTLFLGALACASPFVQDGTLLQPHVTYPASATAVPGPAALAAAAARMRALLTNVPGAATNVVPGLGVPFQPGIASTHFDRVYGHPSGHWVLTAFADLPTSRDECLILDGQLVIQEGMPAPWTNGENCGTLDQRVAVNRHGDVVLATNTSGTVNDDWIAGRVGGVWTAFAREGDPVPGLPGAVLDDALDSPLILDDGRVGYAADGVDGVAAAAFEDMLILGAGVLMQSGHSFPAGQSGTPRAMENYDLGDFWTSGDGTAWLVQGDLEGSTTTDDVVVVNGVVVLQEGSPIPGAANAAPIDTSGILGVSMAVDGTWFARGDFDPTNDDWVVRNGIVVATTGWPITPGATERWSDDRFANGFFAHVGNGRGDDIIGGTTDQADPALDSVLVLNGRTVVARESDPVDLDGNGLFDDDAFIDVFGDDDIVLTDDLRILVVANLKNGAGAPIGQALVEIEAGVAIGVAFCDPVPNSTGSLGELVAVGSDVVAHDDLSLFASGLPPRQYVIALIGSGRASIPGFNGGQGTLCLGAPVAAFRDAGDIMLSGVDGTVSYRLDLSAVPWPSGPAPVAVGQTMAFQMFHRDWTPAFARTSNLTRAVEVTFR